MKRIVFIGNCQLQSLSAIYQAHAAKRQGDEVFYIRAENAGRTPEQQRIAAADAVVGQLTEMGNSLAAVAPLVRDKEVVLVPHAAGAFLWPQAGEPHVAAEGLFSPRFGTDFGDRYLNRAIRAKADPAETIRDYVTVEFGRAMQLERRFEISIGRQEERDRQTGFDVAGIVRRHLRDEYLFRSQGHPQLRIMRHLAERLFRALRVGADAIDGLLADLTEWNIPTEPNFAPIHPAVIDHFGLGFVTPESRYALWDEHDTFHDFAYRYMGLGWNLDIEEGLAAGRRGELAAAEEKLRHGLSRSPRSARAHVALAEIFERTNRLEAALSHAAEAIRLEPHAPQYHSRLGRLRAAAKDFSGAIAAAAKAAELDPASDFFQHTLSDLLLFEDRLSEAIAARKRSTTLAPLWPHHWRRLGELLRRAGDSAGAEAALRRAAALDPAPAHD